MEFLKKLAKVKDIYVKRLTAMDPELTKISNVVKSVIDDLLDLPEMKGVLYASNVEFQHLPEYYHVSFVLNIDRKLAEQMTATQQTRESTIKRHLSQALMPLFSMPVKVDFGEVSADKPGWFGKKYE